MVTESWYVPAIGATYSTLYRPSGCSETVATVVFAGAENFTFI